MGRGTANPDIIKKFLALTEKEREQIQENGLGLYCLIIPVPLDYGLLNQFTELHQMPNHIIIEYGGKQYLAVPSPISAATESALKLPERIWMPYEVETDKGRYPIEQYIKQHLSQN
jgi:hypothetical protein